MKVKDNWVSTNLLDRKENSDLNFLLTINPCPLEDKTFSEYSDSLAREIYSQDNNLFLLLSGGIDSEYVLNVFLRSNIPIKPLIIVTPYNKKELSFAVRKIQTENLNPIVVELSEQEIWPIVIEYCNGHHWYAAPWYALLDHVAGQFTNQGTVITGIGEPALFFAQDDGFRWPGLRYNYTSEMEFYLLYHPSQKIINFFLYDKQIYYCLLNELINLDGNSQTIKCKLYGLNFRPKIFISDEFTYIADKLLPKSNTVDSIAPHVSSLKRVLESTTPFVLGLR